MKNMKKVLSLLLVLVMCVGLVAGCGKGETKTASKNDDPTTVAPEVKVDGGESAGEIVANKSLPPMTTEKITLTYASWENEVLTTHLAQKFMEKYPNITVELVSLPLDGYNDALLNLVATAQLPDAFWILGECDFAIANDLLGDMTEFWENDPEADNVLTTINDGKYGYYGTDKKWATPVKFFPETIFANMTVFEQLNKEMPSGDWTWEDMVNSIKEMTVPEQSIYGFNQFRTIVTWYPVAADSNVWGEFGWDGTKFDMTHWADGVNLQAELINGKYHAPYWDTDEAEAAFGDRTMWAAYSGKIAYQFDAWWTFNNLFASQEYLDLGLVYVPYTVPRANGTSSTQSMATMDFGGISSATEYPREAYELLKFMNWNEEGWMEKLYVYNNLTNADGTKVTMDALPLTLSETVWSEVRKAFPGDDDEYGRGPFFDAFLANCKEPIPYGGTVIPGFGTFIAEAYAGSEAKVFNEGINAHDLAPDLAEKANAANAAAMDILNNK